MKRDADSTPTFSRSRKKTAVTPPASGPVAKAVARAAASEPGEQKNVGSLEGGISLAAGVLFLVAALVPRSLKQLLLLSIGGGLVYRGMSGKCGVYSALGIDTAKAPLLQQINEKFLSSSDS